MAMPRGGYPVDFEDLVTRFTYHAPKDQSQKDRYEYLRGIGHGFAESISKNCPPSRERSLALTKLEEAVMWANAAIARNEGKVMVTKVEVDTDPKSSFRAFVELKGERWPVHPNEPRFRALRKAWEDFALQDVEPEPVKVEEISHDVQAPSPDEGDKEEKPF
jgi:hypothetical protein